MCVLCSKRAARASWGLFITGGVSEILPRLVGLRQAREMILLSEFDAKQAQSWGLLRDVFADKDLMPTAREGLGLEAAMAAETKATVRGFFDPETAIRVGVFSK